MKLDLQREVFNSVNTFTFNSLPASGWGAW